MGGTEVTPEQQRKMLECAAKACGIECEIEQFSNGRCFGTNQYNEIVFDPINNPADTAEMCAKLKIATTWGITYDFVDCSVGLFASSNETRAWFKDYDNSRMKAWMYAVTMVAAKIGDLK